MKKSEEVQVECVDSCFNKFGCDMGQRNGLVVRECA